MMNIKTNPYKAVSYVRSAIEKALERCFEQPVPAEVYDALAVQLAAAAKEAAADGKKE